MDDIFQRQVRPSAGAPQPFVDADQFGAGIGRAVEQLGNTVQQERLQDFQIEQKRVAQEEWAQFQHGFALGRENMDGIAREARTNAEGGARGHTLRMREAWEAQRDSLLEGITDRDVKARAITQFEEVGQRFRTGEADWEDGKRAEKMVFDFSAARDMGANRVRRLGNPSDYTAELEIQFEAIDALGVDENSKDKLRGETEQIYAVQFLRGRIDEDPGVAKALLAGGAFDAILQPNQVEALMNGADVEIRSQQVAAAREAAAELAAAKEQIATLVEFDRQGVVIPEDQLEAAAQVAAASGDTSLAVKLDGIKANNIFARVYEKSTPLIREGRMADLAAKEKRTANEDRELQWLQTKSGALDNEFNSDPVRSLAKHGGVPPIDLGDPASLQARSAWARQQTEATGRYVPPMSAAEAAPMRDLYAKGNGGKKQVFDLLDNFAPDDRVSVARMIAPQDTVFQELSTLRSGWRDRAVEGREALKANAALLKSDRVEVEDGMLAADAAFNQATRFMESDRREAVRAIGKHILASFVTEGNALTERAMQTALQRAMGAEGSGANQTGGMKRWGGTDSWFLLPDGVNGASFAAAVAKNNRENPAVAAVNPDGSPANLNRATPVALGGGWYEFHTVSGEVVKAKTGRNYRVRVFPK